MTPRQKLEIRSSEIRQRLNALSGEDELTTETREETDRLVAELGDVETKLRAAIAASEEREESRQHTPDAEERERLELREQASVAEFVAAAFESRSVSGPSADYSQAMGLAATTMPIELLAPSQEERTETDANTVTTAGTWLDRILAETAAAAIGVTTHAASPGQEAIPVTTAGAAYQQRARDEAAAASAWSVGVSMLTPKLGAVAVDFTIQDAARLPGLEDALTRDLRQVLAEGVDRAVFLGDTGADGTDADITGIISTANIATAEIGQTAKATGEGHAAALAGLINGAEAARVSDLRVVASIATLQYVLSNKSASGNAVDQSISQYLDAIGLGVRMGRAGLDDTATAENDYAYVVGRGRGIAGAAVIGMWGGLTLVRDVYSSVRSGGVQLTGQYLWDFAVPRPSNFALVDYGS